MPKLLSMVLIGLLGACAPSVQSENVPMTAPEPTPMVEAPPEPRVQSVTQSDVETSAPTVVAVPEEPQVQLQGQLPQQQAQAAPSEAAGVQNAAPPARVTPQPQQPAQQPVQQPAQQPANAGAGQNPKQGQNAQPQPQKPSKAPAVGSPEDTIAHSNTISVSSAGGKFVTGEKAPLTVAPGSLVDVRLQLTHPQGIREVQIELRNSPDKGPLPRGPFSLNDNTDCQQKLASAPTKATCTVSIRVADDATPINEAGEVGYALRPTITYGAGEELMAYSWAYLNIQP